MIIAASLTMALITHLAATEEIPIAQIAGEGDPGPYRHPASIAELENGDLVMAYYGGSDEYGSDTAVYAKRLKKGEATWGTAETFADTPWIAEGNPVIWQAPDGLVWLWYVTRYGATWSESIIQGKISKDGAHTWLDSFILTSERGSMVRGKPILLEDGRYLLPVYHEKGHDREVVAADTVSSFFFIDPKAHTWVESGRITSRIGNLQPAPIQLDAKHLIAFCRRGGGYTPEWKGYIVRSDSFDGGQTWSEGRDTEFPNPNAAVDTVKLANGHIVLVFNDSFIDRSPLTVAISEDGGATWPRRRDLIQGNDDFAYPYAIQARDGQIHVVFTSHGRTTIHHAVFDEAAIGAQKP